jgi:pSer/pThr/pTyr-binding forkhead associated (FHA) protein
MRDGRTVKRDTNGARDAGFDVWSATLVVLEGSAPGAEHPLRDPRTILGRGPAAGVLLADDEVSQQHAAVEFTGEGFRVVDLGSTNGTRVNGEPVQSAELDHGDRLQIGRHVIQLVVEKHDAPARVYVVDD